MKVAIAGATGFVGTGLVERLHREGDQILVLSRDPQRAGLIFPTSRFPRLEIVAYTPERGGSWQEALSGCDGVVNLAGGAIAERWTPERKREIINSRQVTTLNLVNGIAQAHPRPSVLVSASAVGYYGTSETASFDETSPPGTDFLAEVCQQWEAAAEQVKSAGVRLAIIRIGIVLGEGGALAKMVGPFKVFVGGPIGSGQQWLSWIHRDDLVNLLLAALKRDALTGVYNGTAPNPVRMTQFSQTLGEVMNRPSWLPFPALP
ncbi:MAG: TIGR01777 family protein, partial [Chloroflexaceae bacterium]|nr:TIGR01777 family protein [Chloroflexaceae bacterium]